MDETAPCAVCTEPGDLMPVVWLRQSYELGPGVESNFRAQYECCVCGSRGPIGVGSTPEAALLNALTSAAEDARRHRAWVESRRPSEPTSTSAVEVALPLSGGETTPG